MSVLRGIGTDPEVFVTENGAIIPGIGLIGGTKEEPMPVNKGAVQEDNVLAEFNIDPAFSPKEFIANIREVMKQLSDRVGPGRGLVVQSSHHFTKEVLIAAGQKALEFGCDPDFNAWTESVNQPPNPLTTLRTAGGHVHTSFDCETIEDSYAGARMMDYFLGLPSVLLDDDTERRSMYGKAGACRPKLVEKEDPYNGVEYRTLSNFWLKSDELIEWVYHNTNHAVKSLDNSEDFQKELGGDELQRIINESDAKAAKHFVTELNIALP